MNPTLQLWLGWGMFSGACIGWPWSALTVAREEPQFILGLSWVAIITTALTFIEAAAVRKRQERAPKRPQRGG